MNLKVVIDKVIVNRTLSDNYTYDFQFSDVSRESLVFIVDSVSTFKVTGAWLQPDGTYVIQGSLNEPSEELIEYLLDSCK